MPPKSTYRFTVGTEVLCFVGGSEGWAKGVIIALSWRQDDWPEGKVAPYQVRLGGGGQIFVPEDVPQLCKRYVPPAWAQAVTTENLRQLKSATAKSCDEADDFGWTPLLACLDRGWQDGAIHLIGRRADPCRKVGPENASPLHFAVRPLTRIVFQDSDGDDVTFLREEGVINATLTKADFALDDIDDPCVQSISYDENDGKLTWIADAGDGESWSILPPHLQSWVPGRLATMAQGTAVKTSGLPKGASCIPIVKALLQASADVNAQNEDPENDLDNFTSTTYSGLEQRQHRSPLHYAAEAGEAGLCAQLIAARADIDVGDRFKMSPLDLGLEGESQLVVDILLRKAADPNRGNMSRGLQQTCLHQVSDTGRAGYVKLILQHGGNVNAAGKQEMTPLHFAARKKHLDVVEVLLNAGADATLVDASGRTPGYYAKVNKSVELCAALADGLQLEDRIAILERAKVEKEQHQKKLEEHQAMINGYGGA